jgi:hypothetical protein
MSFFNTLVKYKIGCILNEMDLNIIEKKQIDIYLNLCSRNALNINIFKNSSYKLQHIIITIFINCLKAVDEEENKNFNNLYNKILEMSEKEFNEATYLNIAHTLKQLHNYNNLFGCENSQKAFNFNFKIIDEDNVLFTFDEECPLNINNVSFNYNNG